MKDKGLYGVDVDDEAPQFFDDLQLDTSGRTFSVVLSEGHQALNEFVRSEDNLNSMKGV